MSQSQGYVVADWSAHF